ncbi:serine protease [candidate division TA06 bacterium]|uniref:Serine protease n=1 Tax=candidate division TA06 bacterium TaxID=2250710 RepID=A0A933IA75_UNCT6|nr:serine protease [candidate division TA06 bacterium]
MKKIIAYNMLMVALFTPICCAQDIARIVEDVGKSVVVVIGFNVDSTANKLGSGCFINNKGVILTNAHVIDSCLSLQIELTDTIIEVAANSNGLFCTTRKTIKIYLTKCS